MPTDATAIVYVLASLASLAVAANQLFALRNNIQASGKSTVSVTPDPHSEYRTRADCIAICEKDRSWIRRVEQAVPAVERQSRAELKTESDHLQQRIDTLHTSMNSQFNNINGRLCRIAGRLGIPEEQDQ
jgi:hypothetical protein